MKLGSQTLADYLGIVAPLAGARIETNKGSELYVSSVVAPLAGARIETVMRGNKRQEKIGRPSCRGEN